MTDVTHTAGEWFVRRNGFSTVYIESRIGGGMVQEVAACGPTAGGPDEQAANADLIAAAPKLRHALTVALAALESCTPGDYSTGHVIYPQFDEQAVASAYCLAQAVLLQSEGGPK